jgi:hypothetical protein
VVGIADLLRQVLRQFILTLFGEPDISEDCALEVAIIQEDQCVCFWIHVNDQVVVVLTTERLTH